jgi:hypothetical protein
MQRNGQIKTYKRNTTVLDFISLVLIDQRFYNHCETIRIIIATTIHINEKETILKI